MNSEDIIKAVKTYIEMPDTNYAIMIDGEWGCGKTQFWKNELLPIVGKSEAIYVSLFGLKDINDIEHEIFKTVSSMGTDDEGNLKGLLNSLTKKDDEIMVGGIGFAVHFGLKKWKEKKLKKSKSLFICFDDLERWSGDIEICLSYINKMVEHDGTKCLIIGSSKEIQEGKNKDIFNKTKEKTIRFRYKLSYFPEHTLKIAIEVAKILPTQPETYIKKLLNDNKSRIYDLLSSVNCSNIRTVSTAIHYFAIIAEKNIDKFTLSPANAILYFISLLSTLILVEHHKNSDEERAIILNSSENNILKIMEKLGIKYKEELSNEEKIIETLMAEAFYPNQIQHKGKSSIINHGFYGEEDFEEEFLQWKKTEDYEYYLDAFEFLSMEDKKADDILKNTYKAIFDEKITNPFVLLSLTNRLTNDIKRGTIELDFQETKNEIKHLFNELYKQEKMEHIDYIEKPIFESFQYCEDIYSEVVKKNKEYNENYHKNDLSKFWVKLKENKNSLAELMKKYRNHEIFSLYDDKPEEIVDIIDSLNNELLFYFSRWMGSRLQNSIDAVQKEHDRAQVIVQILEERYKNKFGVKAGHIKQIYRILKNKKTDYDPEYIEPNRNYQEDLD